MTPEEIEILIQEAQELIELIRAETQKGGNTKERVANTLTKLNNVLTELNERPSGGGDLTLEQARQNGDTVDGVILGSDEFNKQGDRKAFAQMSDVYDNAGTLRADLDAEIVNRAIGDSNLQTQVNTNNTAIADLNVHSIEITTSSSITTNTTDANGKTQNGREVAIKNGVNAINITCELTSSANFLASYTKEGSAAITVVAGAGTTLYQTDGTNVINGIKGSTFCIKRSGNEFQLQVSNRS